MNKKKQFLKFFGSSLFFFLISAGYGWLMRVSKIWTIDGFPYTNFMHSHSHVAFLGWGFLSVVFLIMYILMPEMLFDKKVRLYIRILQASLLAMLVSFPLQGYKAFSIGFLTVFLLTSYVLLYTIYKKLYEPEVVSKKIIRAGIVYYYISSLAIWAIPFIKIFTGKGVLYKEAVGFYLHFLYDGFFTLVLVGLMGVYLYRNEEKYWLKIVPFNLRIWFYRFFTFSVIPTFFLISYTFREHQPAFLFYLTLIGSLSLVPIVYLAFRVFLLFCKYNSGYFLKPLLFTFFISFILKTCMEIAANIPWLNTSSLHLSSYLFIGYLHSYTLGFMSASILWLYFNFIRLKLSIFGMLSLFIGYIISEFLLFGQGGLHLLGMAPLSDFDMLIAGVSTLMPLGVFILWISHFYRLGNME